MQCVDAEPGHQRAYDLGHLVVTRFDGHQLCHCWSCERRPLAPSGMGQGHLGPRGMRLVDTEYVGLRPVLVGAWESKTLAAVCAPRLFVSVDFIVRDPEQLLL